MIAKSTCIDTGLSMSALVKFLGYKTAILRNWNVYLHAEIGESRCLRDWHQFLQDETAWLRFVSKGGDWLQAVH